MAPWALPVRLVRRPTGAKPATQVVQAALAVTGIPVALGAPVVLSR